MKESFVGAISRALHYACGPGFRVDSRRIGVTVEGGVGVPVMFVDRTTDQVHGIRAEQAAA